MASLWPTNQTTLARHLTAHPSIECIHFVPDCNCLLKFIQEDGLCLVFEQQNEEKKRIRVPLTALAGTITYDANGFCVTKGDKAIKYNYCGEVSWTKPKEEKKEPVIDAAHYFECEDHINEVLRIT